MEHRKVEKSKQHVDATRRLLEANVYPVLGARPIAEIESPEIRHCLSLGRVYFNTDAAYYVKLFGFIDWNISFCSNWDNRPPSHFSGSDYGTSSRITHMFGNK
jgi:hypothetical protein